MKIVFVIEKISCIGGLQRILTERMNYLARRSGYEIILMTVWQNKERETYQLDSRVKRVPLNVSLGYGGMIISMPMVLCRFNKEIRRINPDVTVLMRAIGAFLASFSSWKGYKVYESHVPLRCMNHKWVYPLMRNKVDSIVCLTEGDASDYKNMFGSHQGSMTFSVIPNFTDMVTASSPDGKSRIIMSAGRVCPEKDFERLEQLWDKVKATYPDWILKIHHATKDMREAYQESAVYVMTSKFESFGLVLIEAMACGLPCVAFDCPYGPREIIEDGKNGFLVPYDDDEMFIEKLNYLMEHPEVREQMGKAAKESVKRFSVDNVMQKWEQFYNALPH